MLNSFASRPLTLARNNKNRWIKLQVLLSSYLIRTEHGNSDLFQQRKEGKIALQYIKEEVNTVLKGVRPLGQVVVSLKSGLIDNI